MVGGNAGWIAGWGAHYHESTGGQAGRVRGDGLLSSGAGDIHAQLLHPAQQLEASSGAGDIVLTVPNVAYAVTTSSGVGNITDSSLSIDPGSPRRINASAGAGDVTIQASR